MRLERGIFLLLGLSILGTGWGCAIPTDAPGRAPEDPVPLAPRTGFTVTPQGSEEGAPEEDRHLAFVACRDGQGEIVLWDRQARDVFVLNGALAGVRPSLGKHVAGPGSCEDLAEISPTMVNDHRVMFGFKGKVYVWDMTQEVRLTVATDARSGPLGGPSATVAMDGRWVAYLNQGGHLVLKETDGSFATKSRELVKIAAEGEVWDFDLSEDGRWFVLNVEGRL